MADSLLSRRSKSTVEIEHICMNEAPRGFRIHREGYSTLSKLAVGLATVCGLSCRYWHCVDRWLGITQIMVDIGLCAYHPDLRTRQAVRHAVAKTR